jgi:hypothetical protein
MSWNAMPALGRHRFADLQKSSEMSSESKRHVWQMVQELILALTFQVPIWRSNRPEWLV